MTEPCPFTFNFDPTTFKIGDVVSFRMASLGEFPFVGQLVAVHDDHVELVAEGEPEPRQRYRASRTSRPVVT